MPFLNEKLPEPFNVGSSWTNRHAAEMVQTANGNEYRRLRHPYIEAMMEIDLIKLRDDMLSQIINFNHKANGSYRAFRVRHPLDFSTAGYVGSPSAFDQPMQIISPGVYQIMRWYGDSNDAQCARRRIRKPVSGTVIVGANGELYSASLYTVDYDTGIVTFNANKTATISAITKANQAVITLGTHTIQVGESVFIAGVLGMTQINNQRAIVIARTTSTITVDINSLAYGTYTSGGTVNTQPNNAVEAVTAGCYFDIPMRFDSDLSGVFAGGNVLTVSGISLMEVLNPD